MPTYRERGGELEAERIYCVYERSRGPRLVGTGSRHNAQGLLILGNPATAVILKPLRFVRRG